MTCAQSPLSRYRETLRKVALCLPFIIAAPWAPTSAACDPTLKDCVAPGTWEFKLALGAGLRTNPVIGADNIPLILLPQISYYGKRFFWDNFDLGYTLVDRPNWMLNLLATADTDGLYFFQDDWGRFFVDGGLTATTNQAFSPDLVATPERAEREGDQGPQTDKNPLSPSRLPPARLEAPALSDRHVAALGGLETSGDIGPLQWQLQLLSDISGVHDGQTARFAVSSSTSALNGKLGLSTGFNWKSAEIMEYYYGVTEGEATTGRPTYRPSSGTSPFLRLSWSRPVNERWHWLGSVQYEYLSEAMRHSPLIDRDEILQIFVGGVYHF